MELSKVFMIVIIVMLFVLFFIPIVKQIAIHVSALDIPNARKVHKKPIARLGGLGIYAGFLLGFMIFGYESVQMNAILIGSIIIIITGIIDDIKPVPAKYKFIGQLVSAAIIPIFGGIVLRDLSFFGVYLNFGIFSYVVTIFFILNDILNPTNIPLFSGFFEISQGLNTLIIANISYKIKEILAIFFISFGGLSIHLQIKGILSDTKISYKTFFLYRIYQSILSVLFICVI